MNKAIEIINETLTNLNQRQIQGIGAADLVTFVYHQLIAISEVIVKNDEKQEAGEIEEEKPE